MGRKLTRPQKDLMNMNLIFDDKDIEFLLEIISTRYCVEFIKMNQPGIGKLQELITKFAFQLDEQGKMEIFLRVFEEEK